MNLYNLFNDFFEYLTNSKSIEVYNEFSLQHELGIFLREHLTNYKVQFERNVSFFSIKNKTIKKEIDIVIFNSDKSEIYSIELKYPRNGQYPEQLYSFTKDLVFAEELKRLGFTKTYTITLVDDRNFYSGKNCTGIYGYYRNNEILHGKIYKPTGSTKNIDYIELFGQYQINWRDCAQRKYYILETQ